MKDSYYFQHDSNARNDPKIKALINKYGMEGYGRFWIIIEMLRESTGYKLNNKTYIWNALAEHMHCTVDEVKSFVKECIEEFELFEQDGDYYYSQALLTRMIKLDSIRQKRSYASKTRWEQEV